MSAPAVPLEGKLEDQSFTALLRALLRERRDGCLSVTRGAITRRLYLQAGMIVYGSSTERSDRLGEILIAQGKLTKAGLKRFWEQSQTSNRLLGQTLVVNGCISMSDLYQGVTAQVVTILERLQKWRKGEYRFEEGCAPAPGTVLLCIPLSVYLKGDAEKKPSTKKTAKAPARTRGAAAEKRPAVETSAAAPPPEMEAPGDGAEEEQEFEIDDAEPDGSAPIDFEAARELERVGEVSFMVQELRKRFGQDARGILGVAPSADRAIAQQAYHRIAKVLHTDRLPRSCPPELVAEAEDVFREIGAAFEQIEAGLLRPAGAAAPEAPAASARKAPSDADQAKRFFAQGREWISKRNYWQASDSLRQAVRLAPDEALYRQYLGLALMQTKRLHEAEEHLVEATRLEPGNAAHFVNLGRIYRSGRLYKKAREAFERALRLDPRNEHALDELSDLPEEAPPVRRPEAGGFLKKLFGKD